ncbi:S8 family serine peptidase [Actinomadura sp. DC4]|uniref:S8 family serine peptidase n=1 Tax=Actinomadura sp. DC4 TaxID=3055069 RepID=UPI0025AF4563|nr:S8 family serine peptidase [Actinomadura sp. DC4]MDN3359981.1 S8 family serine peptidase [Actinomadura sp. DC4]
MHVFEPRRTVPRVASALLVSAAVGVLSVPAAQSASPTLTTRAAPADLYRGQQWTLDALHISRAWKYSRGNGVTVAVLDTGVDGHQPDLSGRVIDGPDFTGHTRKPGGRYWGRHGTEMASLIAGHGHGTGAAAGVMGVAPDAKVLSIRVTWELNDPIRTDKAQVDRARDAVAKGIRYAADHGAQVISMSLGGGNLFYNGNTAEEAAIKYALGKGSVLIASAGNDGNAANRRNYPAAYPGVIAVGAVDRGFKPAKFTNRHTYISVAAPGVEIVSADVAGHGYILGTGTSSSAAFVAGMSALVKARYPRLTPAEVKQSLEEGATHRPPDGRSTEIGTGVADAYGALRTAARINKAEHGGTTVETPPSTSRPAPPAASHGPDLLLIAVLSGGGTLIVLSLILGWRQRRRRAPRGDDDDEISEETPVPSRPPAHSAAEASWERRPSGPPSGLSPWERRPPEAAPPSPSPDLDQQDEWDSSPPVTPWERRRPRPTAPNTWSPEPAEAESWNLPAAEPEPLDRPDQRPSWDPEPVDQRPSWDLPVPDPEPVDQRPSWDLPVPSWDPEAADRQEQRPSWDLPAAEPSWEAQQPEADSWNLPPAEPEAEPGRRRSWDAPPAEPSWQLPPAEPEPPEPSYEPYEPPPRGPEEGNGSNGRHRASPPRDFRVAGGQEPDPLTDDAPIDSSSDMGTPLADESWDSIRRGFDRLKDASNWESLANGDLDDDAGPAQDAFDETASMPIVDPDEDEKN